MDMRTGPAASGWRSVVGRGLLFVLGAATALSLRAATPELAGIDELEIGRRIYQEGVLPSGAPLTGMRRGGASVSGAAAACVNCHRRSGMGSVEGDTLFPPVTGNYLFGNGSKNMATMDPRRGKALNQAHESYTGQALARAIRQGENNSGNTMNVLMPRYALDEAEMRALTAYLGQLSRQWSPGVTASTIRFATVIAPGVEPARRQALIDMMRAAVVQKNGSTLPGRRHMVSPAEMLSRTERTWALDVWELQGAPDTWGAQLDEHYRRQPVFALVSGLSNGTWAPVHNFCERERVPCWFPSVGLPPPVPAFYSVYFSRGVALEAEVLARHLLASGKAGPQRLVQLFRNDEVGRAAAQALRQALAGSDIRLEDRELDAATPQDMATATAGIGKDDALMLWLVPADRARLGRVRAAPAGTAYFSTVLGEGGHDQLPPAWKGRARLVYPYELPERRQANLSYFHQWLKLRKLPLVDEALQSEVYFSLGFLTDTLADMLDNLYRDYLLERAENMLSRREGSRIEQEGRERVLLGWKARAREAADPAQAASAPPSPAAVSSARHESTTVYPRLGLGPDQRFASKGGYIVRFAGADSDRLVPVSDWIVP